MWFNVHFWTLCGQKILSEMNSVVGSSFPFQRYRTCEHVYIKMNARVNTAFCSGLILFQWSWKKEMFSSSLVPQHALLALFFSVLSKGQSNEVHNIVFAKSGHSCIMFCSAWLCQCGMRSKSSVFLVETPWPCWSNCTERVRRDLAYTLCDKVGCRCNGAWSWTQADSTARVFEGGGSLRTSGNLVENQEQYLPSPRTSFPSHLLNTKA